MFKFLVGSLLLVLLYVLVTVVLPAYGGQGAGAAFPVGDNGTVVAGGFYEPETIEASYSEVVESVLARINEIRESYGLPPLTLMTIGVAEYRAGDMVANRYFGHCTPDGVPFFYYYSTMGGVYYPEENIGLTVATRGTLEIDPVSESIAHVDRMVFDDADSDWGHRDSLLDPTNNVVDIAVQYDDKMMILEIIPQKAWVNWTSEPRVEDGRVILEGVVALEGSSVESVVIYRYEMPRVLQWPERSGVTFTCETINPGEPVAVVVPAPYYTASVETVIADEWTVLGNKFRIVFDYRVPEGEGSIYYVVLWVENTLGIEHPFDEERYRDSIPALLLVLGEGG